MLDNEPTDGAMSLDGDTTREERGQAGGDVVSSGPSGVSTTPRRRSASRPAGPPPEPDDLPPPVTTVAAANKPKAAKSTVAAESTAESTLPKAAESTVPKPAEPAETPAQEEPVAKERPKRVTRRRTKTAEVPTAEAPAAEEPVAETPPAETVTAAAGTAVAETAPVADDEPAAPTRRRRTRKRTDETEPSPEQAEKTAQAVQAEEPAAPKRRRRVRAEEPEPERSRVMSAAEAEVAAALRLNLPDEEPLDDEPLDIEDVDLEDVDTEEDGGRPDVVADPFGLSVRQPSVPSVTFQAPSALFQPLFQAPDPFAVPAQRPASPAAEPVAAEDEEAEEPEETAESGEDESEAEGGTRRRRRRRGGRGRGTRARDGEDGEEQESEGEEPHAASAEEDDREQAEDDSEGQAGTRRRRRRRRRGTEEAELAPDDPPNTVVRIRAPRATRSTSVDEVQGVRGSTRLEAKKQRRREGRELGRRRPPIITESEFLARRESVERIMVVRRQGGRTQIAVLEDGILVEHYVDRESSQSYVGNVYLGKVQNVLPSMEAAFVDIGKGRNAVLYAGEVNFDTAGLEGQPKRIEAALKSGQSVLVQVTKDPIGHKGARLTSQISLPGRYLVYVPDGSMTGISRKLPDKERARLKQILRKVMPENAGVIVRTAAEGASEEELSRDVARLSAQWENIQRKAKSASPPELLSGEPDLTIRVVRDVFNEDFSSLVVEGDEAWTTVDEYVRYVAPHLAERLSKWEEETDAFSAYRIDEQIAKAMERKVWLPSGGSLVIDRTEAMTVVDVNTGKFTGQGGNLEETVTRNNLEAAEEIVRQLRLRDIGGIIVIDFIDMVLESNRDLVLRRLLECLARDRTKHQVAEVTSLGLVQMTRKRVGQGLLEAFSTPCECCHGRGIIVSTEPVEAKPEPRGTQGKMAIEKAVAEKLATSEGSVAAASGSVRESVTDAIDAEPTNPDEGDGSASSSRGRRRSRRKTAE
ncbi:Rne/Rng family ribonuclease [Microbispora sp. NEAU-D428]|uniref:Rne/Rng family ribonuclease n=1 Tax=Microbispora sitophila TaxID=2771537 RepID=UPI001869613C|nr:Rne/Rng family ribonuclease [Microbispora sitophila]MBE3012654.1 Rne/Rng family ribonuclease [Microbispora sitophila]